MKILFRPVALNVNEQSWRFEVSITREIQIIDSRSLEDIGLLWADVGCNEK
jgi:hypothetical protein